MSSDTLRTAPTRIVQSPLMARLAAIGFFVYGGVYVLVGALAAKVAMGTGGRLTNSQGAIRQVAREPFGEVLLVVIAIGLFAYAGWRLAQAIADPEHHGRGWKGVAIRGGRLVSAASYGALAVFTVETLTANRASGGDANWALRLITEPVGAVLGTVVALVIIGAGIAQFHHAVTGDFGEPVRESEMSQPERTGRQWAGRVGFTARGIIFCLVGGSLVYAVFDGNPGRAKSVEELFALLLGLPYGRWALGAVAVGLAGYGMLMILVALHRRHPY
jgi:hypothetical protein